MKSPGKNIFKLDNKVQCKLNLPNRAIYIKRHREEEEGRTELGGRRRRSKKQGTRERQKQAESRQKRTKEEKKEKKRTSEEKQKERGKEAYLYPSTSFHTLPEARKPSPPKARRPREVVNKKKAR
ncbi:hypothetical protein ACLB2K_029689 [Fragaria x ananassa]